MQISVVRGDICTVRADAVVTAGNESLVGGSGVNGAIHAAAGPELLRASRALAPCPAGSAVVTPAFRMRNTSWVIHAVGPIYSGRPADEALLASAYTASLSRADEVGATSVAFPAISTGVYGYPVDEAARVSVEAIRNAETSVQQVFLVAFREKAARLWEQALAS